jgi:glutamate/tyrosine decarboxylase-like PLP-dependent enzyme
MDDLDRALNAAAQAALAYLRDLPQRRVAPSTEAVHALQRLRTALPEVGAAPAEIVAELHEVASPATVASAGGRYFGFVIGGALPSALAASWLAAAWDQNASFVATSPAAAEIEAVAVAWLKDALRIPDTAEGALVTGGTMANFTGLAAARHSVLAREGWDVEARGLFGAPSITVVVSDEVHVAVLKALAMLGMGRERVVRVPTDAQGRMRAERLPPLAGPTVVCLQAGNVNTGSFDPAAEVCAVARAAGAWVHVDGAFGLWARAAPGRAHLAAGFDLADSWATDLHKWLNAPYDSGVALVRESAALRAAMATSAAYAMPTSAREPCQLTPEFRGERAESRRGRR